MTPGRAPIALIFALLLAFTSTSSVAGCRAGTAAARGGQAGYDEAKTFSDQVTQTETQSQSLLQKCVSGITGTMTGPTFPSMQQIFNNMVKQVCYAASSKVNGVVGQVNGDINGIYDQAGSAVQGTGVGSVLGSGTMPTTGGTHVGSTSTSTSTTDWWTSIWK